MQLMMSQVRSQQKKKPIKNLTLHLDAFPTPKQLISVLREVKHLPFKPNLGDIPLEKEHQANFIDLIYSKHELFSLHNEGLGFCDQLTHTILTSTEKPVYIPHRTISRQIQGEVCKCLNIWFCQGIIHPSNSLYALQVGIVCKKSGEIHLCVDYRKLNPSSIGMHFLCPI